MEKSKVSNKKTAKAYGKSKSKHRNRKRLSLFLYIFLALCILAIVGIVVLIRYLVITCKYSYYTEKMEWYGYNLLYDNESAEASENVLSNEIAKMVSGVLYNVTNKEFAFTRLNGDSTSITDINESWVSYAKSIPLVSANNIVMGENASKLQIAMLLIEGIENVYGRDIEITEKLKEKYREKYTEEELAAIDKGISLGILDNSKSDINKKRIIKGELNKMLIMVAEKYSMMYYNSRYLADGKVNIVTDAEKLPINADKYPYIVDNISKDIYEIEMPEMLSNISETPKVVYESYSDAYDKTASNVTKFFDSTLNVDYRTIDVDSFIDSINQYVAYDINLNYSGEQIYKSSIEEYVNYVKEEEIILSGKATPLLPIIYSNGMLHFIRCKIEFEIVNSKTNANVLLWDKDTTYNGRNITVYADVVVTPTSISKAFRVLNGTSPVKYIVQDENSLVTVK